MTEFKIEPGIPIPPIKRKPKYNWGEMKVNDSIFFEKPVSGLTTQARKATGWKFVSRPEGEGVRIWRVE